MSCSGSPSHHTSDRVINPEVAIPLAIVLATPVGVLLRWFQHRERMARIAAERDRPPVDDARLERLEQAMDAMAIEVERIGEGQRYLTRLLSEGAGGRSLGTRREDSVSHRHTPH